MAFGLALHFAFVLFFARVLALGMAFASALALGLGLAFAPALAFGLAFADAPKLCSLGFGVGTNGRVPIGVGTAASLNITYQPNSTLKYKLYHPNCELTLSP